MVSARTFATLLAPLTRTWFGVRGGARILMYHRITDSAVTGSAGPDQLSVSPALFDEQIAWLSSNRRILPLGRLLEQARQGGDIHQAVALTFDDGYLDNLQNALPVLEKYQAPASVYITSEFTNQTLRHPRYAAEDGRLHLDWSEVSALAAHPLVDIGSHTVSHPMLSELGHAKAEDEIQRSKQVIETHTGLAVSSFCYPSGNFTQREQQLVKDCGYDNALSVKPGVTRPDSDLFALRRTEITWKDTPANLALKMDGAYDLLHRMLDIKRERIFARQRQQHHG